MISMTTTGDRWRRLIIMMLLIWVSFPQTAVGSERLAVTSRIANIRGGPGTTYDIIWKTEAYYPILVLKRQGKWIRFQDYEGDKGWIHGSLVGDLPTVITTRPVCNIRSGPGTKHDILFTVESGVPFKVLEKKGSWLRVEHADGDQGWIHRSLVW